MDRDMAAGAGARDHLRAVEIAGDRGLIHPDQFRQKLTYSIADTLVVVASAPQS
jgi:hypothetical protein